jgi:hypothetical protein
MTEENAHERMADDVEHILPFQERMAAMTRALDETVARRDPMHAMAEEAAQIPHLLLELTDIGVRIRGGGEDQWMPALNAHVFVMRVTIGESHVGVVAQKTGKRMPHAGHGSVAPQIGITAAADAVGAAGAPKLVIVDVVTPDTAG